MSWAISTNNRKMGFALQCKANGPCTEFTIYSDAVLDDGAWHHFAVVKSGSSSTGEHRIFVDGVKQSATATGAILFGVMALIFSTRAAWVSSAMGMVPISRLQANGEIQFDRTPKRDMSKASDFESPTMPSFAAA